MEHVSVLRVFCTQDILRDSNRTTIKRLRLLIFALSEGHTTEVVSRVLKHWYRAPGKTSSRLRGHLRPHLVPQCFCKISKTGSKELMICAQAGLRDGHRATNQRVRIVVLSLRRRRAGEISREIMADAVHRQGPSLVEKVQGSHLSPQKPSEMHEYHGAVRMSLA